ncbi:hypothetical protein, partial [uncultured Sphingomonas sp.]|uniref:hypothetical protein n=1 Tax=uncultured Sphingomonas sp. TaxID=158754 RepID=UPI0035CB26FF
SQELGPPTNPGRFNLLRFSHLAWSAPVTACYGHSYFLTPSEFERLVTVTHQIDNHHDVEDFGLIEVLAAVMNGRITYSDESSARARIERLFLGGALGINFDRNVPSRLEQALATPAGVQRFLSDLDDLGPAFAMEAAAATLARTVGADLRRQLDVLGTDRSSLEDALEAVSHANHRKCEALNTTCCKLLQASVIVGAVTPAVHDIMHLQQPSLAAIGTAALPILLTIATTSTNLKAHVATALKTTIDDSDSDRVIIGELGAFAHRLRSRH